MINKEIITETVKVERGISIVCDVCKKEYRYDNQQNVMEIQEFLKIRFTGGFDSVFGDMVECELDICQSCLLKKFGEYIRRVNLHT